MWEGAGCPAVVVEECSDKSEEDEEQVVLRKPRKPKIMNQLEKSNFENMVMEPFRSRKKTEIGSEKMISEADLRLAATLVHDAMEGRTVDIKTEPQCVRSYNVYKGRVLTYLLYLAVFLNMSLIVFEHPAVDNMGLDYWVTMLVETVTLTYFTARTCHHASWRRTSLFWRDIKNVFVVGILLLTVVDMLVYVLIDQFYPGTFNIRYSRVLRPVLIMNFSDGRQIRRAWRNIRRTIRQIFHVLLLFYFFIFVFALIAYKMFHYREDIVYPDGKPYFKDYVECYWDLYVLVTTANNPDVMMPAYDKSRFYCIFFSVFVVLCLYLLLNVLLAVTYHSYRQNMKEEIKYSARAKRKKLQQAFDVIKINSDGRDMVTYRTWKRLIRLALPKINKKQIDLLMLILDTDNSGHIGRREFMNVADLLNVPVSEVKDRMTVLEAHLPAVYNSTPSQLLRDFVYSLAFKVIFDVAVLVNVFLIAFSVPGIALPFWGLFSLEILLKLYTFGPMKFAQNFINWFDVIIISFSLASIIMASHLTPTDPIAVETLTTINILRIFRVLRLLIHVERFKIITNTIVNISLSIFMYCGIVFIILYIFAVVGMEAFQGRIRYFGYDETLNETEKYCGNVKLKGSLFYESRYCNNNFNDVINAFLVLSTLLIENNWQIIAEGFALVTNRAARIYFAVFHLTMGVVVMNIITAFVVDMFMYEYTIQKVGKTDSVVEAKIKELGVGIDATTGLEISSPIVIDLHTGPANGNGPDHSDNRERRPEYRFAMRISEFVMPTNRKASLQVPTLSRFDGIRFHLKKGGWTKIEVLLQQLFEMELESDTEGAAKPGSSEQRRMV